jgi:hypothetical protein
MITAEIVFLLAAGTALLSVIVIGAVGAAAMTMVWLFTRTIERLARSGHLDRHTVQLLIHLIDRLKDIVRLVLTAVRTRLFRNR